MSIKKYKKRTNIQTYHKLLLYQTEQNPVSWWNQGWWVVWDLVKGEGGREDRYSSHQDLGPRQWEDAHKLEQQRSPYLCETTFLAALIVRYVATETQRHLVGLRLDPAQYHHALDLSWLLGHRAWGNRFNELSVPWGGHFELSDEHHDGKYIQPLQEHSIHSCLGQEDRELASWHSVDICAWQPRGSEKSCSVQPWFKIGCLEILSPHHKLLRWLKQG